MTKIEWANRTWNPVTGCTRVSEGCDHCYMHRMYPRLKGFGTPGYSLEPDMIEQMPDRLGQPMLWKKPARIFVCSMSDFFHNDISGSYRDRMFRAMTEAATERGHIFMVLTKRPAIALSWWQRHRPQNKRMDGARTAEGGEGVTGAMIRARIRVYGRLAAECGAPAYSTGYLDSRSVPPRGPRNLTAVGESCR